MTKAYIAGKITGLTKEEYLRKFNKAKEEVQGWGYKVLSPVEIVPEDLEYEDQMRICFALVDISDCIFMLENWEESNGAILEHLEAIKKGKRIYYLPLQGCEFGP
jgi:hypothetical protein